MVYAHFHAYIKKIVFILGLKYIYLYRGLSKCILENSLTHRFEMLEYVYEKPVL